MPFHSTHLRLAHKKTEYNKRLAHINFYLLVSIPKTNLELCSVSTQQYFSPTWLILTELQWSHCLMNRKRHTFLIERVLCRIFDSDHYSNHIRSIDLFVLSLDMRRAPCPYRGRLLFYKDCCYLAGRPFYML